MQSAIKKALTANAITPPVPSSPIPANAPVLSTQITANPKNISTLQTLARLSSVSIACNILPSIQALTRLAYHKRMARVPIARNLVQQQPMTDAKFRAFDSGAGAIVEGVRDLGSSMKDAAKAWDGIEAVHDETDTRKHDMIHIEGVRMISQTVRQAHGENVGPARAQAEKDFKELNQSLLKQARSPRAKAMLESVIAKRTSLELGALDDYALGEEEKFIGGSIDAHILESREEAIRHHGNPEARDTNIAAGLGEIDKWAQWKGIPTDSPMYAAQKRDFLDGVHVGIVENYLAVGDIDNAQAYLTGHIDDISAATEVRLKASLKGPLQEREAVDGFARAVQLPALSDPATASEPGKGAAAPVANGGDVIKALFPKARVTSTYRPSDHPLSRANPGSWHTKSHAAVDVAPIKGITFDQYVQEVQDAGYTVLEAKNEVGAGRSAHATGDHWHIVLGKGGPQGPQQAPRRWDKEDTYRRIDGLADKEGWSFERRERTKKFADVTIAREENLVSRREEDAMPSALDVVDRLGDGFTEPSHIPKSRRLAPNDRITLKNRAEANRAPKAVPAHGDAAVSLERASIKAPEAFIKEDLRRYQHLMTPSEYASLLITQEKMKKEGASGKTTSIRSNINGAIEFFTKADRTLARALDPKKNPVAFMRTFKDMEGYVQSVTKGQREPSDAELEAAFKRATMKVFVDGEEKTRAELGGNARYQTTVPVVARNEILRRWRDAGNPDAPPDGYIGDVYLKYKGRAGYWN